MSYFTQCTRRCTSRTSFLAACGARARSSVARQCGCYCYSERFRTQVRRSNMILIPGSCIPFVKRYVRKMLKSGQHDASRLMAAAV